MMLHSLPGLLVLLLAADEAKPDPVATQLLADARAARAVWVGFPGFTADVEVNLVQAAGN